MFSLEEFSSRFYLFLHIKILITCLLLGLCYEGKLTNGEESYQCSSLRQWSSKLSWALLCLICTANNFHFLHCQWAYSKINPRGFVFHCWQLGIWGILKNTENKSNECVLKWLVVLITSRGSKKFFFQDSKLYVLTVYLACSHMNFSVYVYWPRFQSSRIQSCGICLVCKCQLTWATFWPSAAFQTCLIKKVNVIIR